jgi:hypothetical protein
VVLTADGKRLIWDSTPPEDPEELAAYQEGYAQGLKDWRQALKEPSQAAPEAEAEIQRLLEE